MSKAPVTSGYLMGFRVGKGGDTPKKLILLDLIHRAEPEDEGSERILRLGIAPTVTKDLIAHLQKWLAMPDAEGTA